MQILIPVLMGAAAVVFIVFIVIFDKIAQNARNIDYESGRAKYWHDRWDIIDGKMSNLYTKDQHNFERPRVDLLTEMITQQEEQHSKRLSEMYQRIHDIRAEGKKGVK